MPKRLNISKLKNDPVNYHLAEVFESKLPPSKTDSLDNVEADWARLRDAVYAAALDVVAPTTRKHLDWFDDNNSQIQTLPEEKHRIHRAFLNDLTSPPQEGSLKRSKEKGPI